VTPSQVLKYLESNEAHGQIPATVYLLVNCGLHGFRTDPASGARQIDESAIPPQPGADRGRGSLTVPGPWLDPHHTVRRSRAQHASDGFHRFAGDCRTYNAIADSVMSRHAVALIDLYGFT